MNPLTTRRSRLWKPRVAAVSKLEKVIRIGRKGVTTIPKSIGQGAGIVEGSEVRVKALPYGILLRPLITDPIGTLENLPTKRKKKSSVATVRRLR
jgi:bifunctional DNA-binding transcriptional regulator/antitoxin component of YhaV-PrlF toxin-antitoxin module